MHPLAIFALNVALFSAFPLYLASLKTRSRTFTLYVYISIVLVLGGFLGTVYSLELPGGLVISGGNITYGAFMMGTVMLIIMEHHIHTFRNLIRLVVLVDVFIFLLFNSLSWMLASGVVLNPFGIPPEVFTTSLWILILGGVLILTELLLLQIAYILVGRFLTSTPLIAIAYTGLFVAVLCLDGVLFPIIAFGQGPTLVAMIVGNVTGKLVLALTYSVPLLIFYLVLSRNLREFLATPMKVRDLMVAPRQQLIEELYQHERRGEQLQRDNRELAELSLTDGLTDLANRRHFDSAMAAEWSRAQRTNEPLTLVLADIDFFKQYNDTYGHAQGDECLRQVAELWKQAFGRPTDLAARVGGEEFAIILPATTSAQCLPGMERFRQALHARAIAHEASSAAPLLTMSIGIAEARPTRDAASTELYERADACLYRAKHAGRDRIVVSED